MKIFRINALYSLNIFAIVAGAVMFATSAVVAASQNGSFVSYCGGTIDEDTEFEVGGSFNEGNCEITIEGGVKVEVVYTSISIADGRLKIEGVETEDGRRPELEFKEAKFTTIAGERMEIVGKFVSVDLSANKFCIGDDFRVKPLTGIIDLHDNLVSVGDDADFRLGDNEAYVDIDVNNNYINVGGDFRAENKDGGIDINNNNNYFNNNDFNNNDFNNCVAENNDFIFNTPSRIQIKTVNGNIDVNNNDFSGSPNQETDITQGIDITSTYGKVDVNNNIFSTLLGFLNIVSVFGECDTNSNQPYVVNKECQ